MALSYQELFDQNEQWVLEKTKEDPEFFERLSMNQTPEFLFIGCSDSRADPDQITGLGLGDIFVHRNIANIVNPIDLNVASVIQYAIENLKVKHIIVCGHYGCGGIKAAMEEKGMGKNSPWLQIIKDIHRIHQKELDRIKDEERRYDRLAELNVIEQVENVLEMDCVQQLKGSPDCPQVHGWIFNMRTGRIVDLKVDFDGDNQKKSNRNPLMEKVLSFFKRG